MRIDPNSKEYQALSEVLKKMWELDNKQFFTPEEAEYYNNHLHIIQNYYIENSKYWSMLRSVEYGSSRVRKPKTDESENKDISGEKTNY